MDQKAIRLFIGNLPPDTSEEDIKNIMKKYASVVSVEVKHRIDALFAFVNLTDLQTDLDACLKKLSLKTWRGHQLRVQVAKESFLQKLERERMNNQKISAENANVHAIREKEVNPRDELIGSDIQNDKMINGRSPIESCDVTAMEREHYEPETSRKGGLPMFQGTEAVFQIDETPVEQKRSKLNPSKIGTSRIHEEKEILGKFEMFNCVWKDEPSDMRGKTSKCDSDIKVKKNKKVDSFPVALNENDYETVVPFAESPVETSLIKQEEAERRRKKALEDRQNELLKRKHVVKFALASVDSINCSRPNKRIFFSDDEPQAEGNENYSQPKDGKLTLFSDDEIESEAKVENDFRIRNQYEGKTGQSLLALQAKYGNDKRFTLDERFIECDENEQEERKTNIDDIQEERQKVFKMLRNVLGKEVPDSDKTKSKHATKLMLRYDPTKPDHEKFEIKQESSSQKSKKKKENDVQASTSTSEDPVDKLPIVSKERYYEISDTLLETLQNKDQKFSLLEMFGEEKENEGGDTDFDTQPIIKKRNEWSLNPFKDDPDASEEETFEQNMNSDNESAQNNVGVRQESLFFSANDARFTEGLEFISQTNEKYMNNFHEIRKDMKRIIKNKILKNRKRKESWKTKIGRKKNVSRKTVQEKFEMPGENTI